MIGVTQLMTHDSSIQFGLSDSPSKVIAISQEHYLYILSII